MERGMAGGAAGRLGRPSKASQKMEEKGDRRSPLT